MSDRDRYQPYREWCSKHRQPERMQIEGFCQIGKYHYRDGAVYLGRKRTPIFSFIPIMRFGSSQIALRWERRYDLLAIEAMRWKLLTLQKERFWPRLRDAMLAFKGKGVIYAHNLNDVLCAYEFGESRGLNINVDRIKFDGVDLLTRLAYESAPTDEGQALATRYEKARARHWSCIQNSGHMTDVLRGMLVDLLHATQENPYDHSTHMVTLNGRVYPITTASLGGPNHVESWPSPNHHHLDVDDPAFRDEATKRMHSYKHPGWSRPVYSKKPKKAKSVSA